MNYRLLIGLVLLAVLVQGVSATDYQYSFVHIGDIQKITATYPITVNLTFSTLESLKSTYNITAIFISGDITDANSAAEYTVYLNGLSHTTIPVYEIAGNHDFATGKVWTNWDTYIPSGSAKHNWTLQYNDFIVCGMEWNGTTLANGEAALDPTSKTNCLANISAYPTKVPIIITHPHMFPGGTHEYVGRETIDTLSGLSKPSIILTGHQSNAYTWGKLRKFSYNNTYLIEDLINTQSLTDVNQSMVRLYTVTSDGANIKSLTTRDVYITTSPSVINNTITYDPDFNFNVLYLNTTSTSVKEIYNTQTNKTFTYMRNGNGGGSGTSAAVRLRSANNLLSDEYNLMSRIIAMINTATVPDTATITKAVFYGYVSSSGKTSALGSPSYGITGVNPGTPGTVANGDYQLFTNTLYSDTNVTNAGAWLGTYNSWEFNTAGLAAINKTGWTNTVIRMAPWDIDNDTTGLTWAASQATTYIYFVGPGESGGWDKDPYLYIEYTMPITTYPVTAINETRILPNSDTKLPPTGSTLSINATPDEYEPVSFVVKPSVATSDLTITATALSDTDGTGHTAIPTSALDIKTLKVWYQAGGGDNLFYATPEYNLTPELLLNDDNIISCNYTNQNCSVWIENATFSGYFLVDNTTINQFPTDAKIYDNKTSGGFPQPFVMTANENRQIWTTVHVPSGQDAGNYSGTFSIASSTTTPATVTLNVRVLPTTLQNATKEHAIFYRGTIGTPTNNLTSEIKTSAQYTVELSDMKNHGALYPVNYNTYSGAGDTNFETSINLRSTSGLPKDHIYVTAEIPTLYKLAGEPLTDLQTSISAMKNTTTTYGFGDLYAYGYDEPNATQLSQMRPSFTSVINNGSKTYMSIDGYGGTGTSLSDVTSHVNIGDYGQGLNSTEAGLYKAVNPTIKVSKYQDPQSGIEDYELQRTNYGFDLWRAANYDGSMVYAYQAEFGQSVWNDYDQATTPKVRDHNFAYPTTDGVIDTIQWEGYREGVDDSRYADTLSYITGNTTEATTIINAGIAAGVDMSVIRGNLIDAILYYGDTVHPTSSFTKSRAITRIPQPVTVTDTSTNTPTSWQWSWGDGSANSTTQNPSHSYTRPGLMTIGLTSFNAAGQSSTTQTVWVTSGKRYTLSPFSQISYSCEDFIYGSSRELTESEQIKTDEKMIGLCYPESPVLEI